MKERKSNLELLRILSMLTIILHHYAVHGRFALGLDWASDAVIGVCVWGGKVAINIFILITGYFMCTQDIKLNKIIKLWLELLFYSVSITLIFTLLFNNEINMKMILEAVFPITLFRHHFSTTYIMLYFFIPFINKFVNTVEKDFFTKFIIVTGILLSVFPTIWLILNYENSEYSYILWMIYIYCIGAYIRKYVEIKNKKWIVIGAIISILVVQISTLFTWKIVLQTYAVPVLICAILVFIMFVNLEIKSNKVINYIATSTFAVYLIHDDIYVRNYIWTNIFKGNELYGKGVDLLLNMLVATIIVFIVCVVIDKLKIILVNMPINELCNYVKNRRSNRLE